MAHTEQFLDSLDSALGVGLHRSNGSIAAVTADPHVRTGLVATADREELSIDDARIMIVDDEPINVKVVRKYLRSANYDNFITCTNSVEALKIIACEQPDLVVLDVMMPQVSGLDILGSMRSEGFLRQIPVLILTADSDSKTKLEALELGATDFLSKPVEPSELVLRVRNALTVKAHQDYLASYSVRLEHQVRMRTAELEASRREVIYIMACAAEYRDQETGNHVIRVGRYAGILADQLGMDREAVESIELAAVLHDAGKIGIPDSILLKPGKLNDDEMRLMKQHCEFGLNILRGVPCDGSPSLMKSRCTHNASPILQLAATIAISHHEKWDGSGYPLGLAGEAIPIEGRVTAVADVFDALSTQRPYKRAMPWEVCCEILEEGRCAHFDPQVLDAFFARKSDIIDVQQKYVDYV